MGKITFRRVHSVILRSKVNAILPVLGGVAFLVGSVYFWPELAQGSSSAGDVGASLFTFGSFLYLVAPLFDFLDMQFSLSDMMTEEFGVVEEASGRENRFERLYKAQMLRVQRANTMLYAVSGVCFVAGSFLFFPWARAQSTHGAWLYLMGCAISCARHAHGRCRVRTRTHKESAHSCMGAPCTPARVPSLTHLPDKLSLSLARHSPGRVAGRGHCD